MGEFIESKNKLTITIDEEYWKHQDSLQEDELAVIVIKYLRRIGKYSFVI